VQPIRVVMCAMGKRAGAWLVAAVVTLALVAGGVIVARGGRDRSPAVLPALDLSATQDAAPAAAAAEPARVGGAEPARPYGPADIPDIWPPVTYKLGGPLPALPDRARAWRVGTDVDPARVAALAAVFGLRGQPKEEPSGWTVRDGGRTLSVNRLAGLPWSFGTGVVGGCVARATGGPDPGGIQCLDPDTPASNQPGASSPGAGSQGSTGSGSASSPGSPGTGKPVKPVKPVKPLPMPRPWTRPPDLPSREQAERIARDLAAKAGLDLDRASVLVADAFAARLVTISPAVGGMPTSGFAWTVGVGPKGAIQHAGGFLATPEPADTYPLIGVTEGFERLKRTPRIRPLLGRAEAPAIADAPCPPATKVPCPAKPLKARVVTVTGVKLGLQLAPAVPRGNQPADVGYLLPAYLFELEVGWINIRPVIAVQDRYLTPPPDPGVGPGPREPAVEVPPTGP
jgi:hypothetical protein